MSSSLGEDDICVTFAISPPSYFAHKGIPAPFNGPGMISPRKEVQQWRSSPQ